MGEVLTQAEIDALLGALTGGELKLEEIVQAEPTKKVRVYDFKRPNKFSKDQIHSLQNIHENWCRSLATYLSAQLHILTETKVLSIEQITYDEFIRSLPSPTILGLYTMNPLEGTALLELSPSLVFAFIDRLLGGEGGQLERNRDLTEIERTLIERRLVQIVELFEEAWREVYEIHPQYLAMETNPQFTQIVAPNEMVVLVTIEVKFGEAMGMVNVCIPYLVLEPILDKLNTFLLFSTSAKTTTPEQVRAIRQKIEKAQVDMIVMLGRAEILVKDMLELAPGDVIPLNHEIDKPLPVYVGNYVKFLGIPGLHGDHLAVQIAEIVKEGRDNNE